MMVMMHGQISPRKRPLEFESTQPPASSSVLNASSVVPAGGDKKTKFEEPMRTRRGPWTPEEDELLATLVKKYGTKKWAFIADLVPGRVGKQCRERWLNHLRTDVKKTAWTDEEDQTLIRAQQELGNRWSAIARLLPGRPENSVKNRWNSLCNKRRKVLGGDSGATDSSGDEQSDDESGMSQEDPSPKHQRLDTCVRVGAPRPSKGKGVDASTQLAGFPYDATDRGPSPQITFCGEPHQFYWSLYGQQQQQLPLPPLVGHRPKVAICEGQVTTPISQNSVRFFPSNLMGALSQAHKPQELAEVGLSTTSSQPEPMSEPGSQKRSSADGLMLLAAACL